MLPPGPRLPMPLQTLGWIVRPGPFLERCRDRYGDAFTLQIANEGTWVMLSDPAAVKQVFTGDPELLHAGEANAILRPILGPSSVLLLDDGAHLAQRKLLLPPFHGERMKAYGALMEQVAETEIATWPAGQVVASRTAMQRITLEIVIQAVFGVGAGAERERLRAALETLLRWITQPAQVALLTVLGAGNVHRLREYRRVMREFDAVILDGIARRRTADDLAERDDILSMLMLATHDDGSPMTDAELRDELVTLLIAGHETTATALAWAVERLVRHPDAWAGLRDGDEAWADAVVKETLRLRPVLPIVVRKLTTDVELAGMSLPAGISVVPCIWLVHRRPDIYPDPHAFKPERWLGQRPGTSTWFPFGGGVRRCIGAAFAEMEMRIALQAIAQGVELEPAAGEPERVTRRAITFTPHRGGAVRARPRNHPAAGDVPAAQWAASSH